MTDSGQKIRKYHNSFAAFSVVNFHAVGQGVGRVDNDAVFGADALGRFDGCTKIVADRHVPEVDDAVSVDNLDLAAVTSKKQGI